MFVIIFSWQGFHNASVLFIWIFWTCIYFVCSNNNHLMFLFDALSVFRGVGARSDWRTWESCHQLVSLLLESCHQLISLRIVAAPILHCFSYKNLADMHPKWIYSMYWSWFKMENLIISWVQHTCLYVLISSIIQLLIIIWRNAYLFLLFLFIYLFIYLFCNFLVLLELYRSANCNIEQLSHIFQIVAADSLRCFSARVFNTRNLFFRFNLFLISDSTLFSNRDCQSMAPILRSFHV